jgi:hypothetical protein
VNRPSVTALRPDHMAEFAPHATLQTEIGKRGNVVRGESSARDGDRERDWRNPGNAGSSEYQEKESNLRLGLFSCIRRRRVTFVLDFC